uniref:Uncharacterized protein n=1 Tax=Petromyzon marinus TaxID=7757 RepID=S4RQ49_PETMA
MQCCSLLPGSAAVSGIHHTLKAANKAVSFHVIGILMRLNSVIVVWVGHGFTVLELKPLSF